METVGRQTREGKLPRHARSHRLVTTQKDTFRMEGGTVCGERQECLFQGESRDGGAMVVEPLWSLPLTAAGVDSHFANSYLPIWYRRKLRLEWGVGLTCLCTFTRWENCTRGPCVPAGHLWLVGKGTACWRWSCGPYSWALGGRTCSEGRSGSGKGARICSTAWHWVPCLDSQPLVIHSTHLRVTLMQGCGADGPGPQPSLAIGTLHNTLVLSSPLCNMGRRQPPLPALLGKQRL